MVKIILKGLYKYFFNLIFFYFGVQIFFERLEKTAPDGTNRQTDGLNQPSGADAVKILCEEEIIRNCKKNKKKNFRAVLCHWTAILHLRTSALMDSK